MDLERTVLIKGGFTNSKKPVRKPVPDRS